ncbi:hypothetical protein Pfo_015379 [Paulownia fortunei]|nr:hypothetical protein Pfo_015379 [Paulownia fortunei]
MLNDLRDAEVVGSSGVRRKDNNENPSAEELGESYISMFEEAHQELYSGSTNFSAFSFLVKLMHVKVLNGWSNKSFNMLLQLLREVFPKLNAIPTSHYEAKKILRELELGYESIHACKNDCILFWDEHEGKDTCSTCKKPQFKYDEANNKTIPQKVLRYFPLKPRLKRLFLSKHIARDMRGHKEKNVETDGVLRHPANAEAWKEFDKLHEIFANDPRNVHLGLATNGFNPLGNMSNAYNMWPVLFVSYNLPPWKMIKLSYMIMSLLILRPEATEKEICVYLRPLINKLKELWSEGIEAYDATTERIFRLHVSTKGYIACPVCLEDTVSQKLRSKICYIGHRRFLHDKHSWYKNKSFNGKFESEGPPRTFSSSQILTQLDALPEVTFGKNHAVTSKRRRLVGDTNWVKKLIFFEHNLDVMHIEKNICDALVGTLLSIDRKSNDTVKARLNMQDMGIRNELHLKKTGDRHEFCWFLKSVKFPDGYALNISRNVNVNDGKLYGLKIHDCHVLLQRLLPITIRKFLPNDICGTIVELCDFFKKLTSTTLHIADLKKMEGGIVFILCKMERIFSPAFFDIMVHLSVHLPREAILAGPVSSRWMYPFERYL